VADAGPLLSATDRRDPAHGLAAALVARLGTQLLIPEPVVVEVDHLLRTRVSSSAARAFLESLARREHRVAHLSDTLFRRAVEIDAGFADLSLGFVDAAVMAIAESFDLPILTFDFAHFRATAPERGHWRLVVDEAGYRAAVGSANRP
jgi:uncharacterized protein